MPTVVFGDTGGHFIQLYNALCHLGFDPASHKLPADLSVVHLGDLVHRGPESEKLTDLVDAIMQANPGQWAQLLGNHELHHVPGAPYFWRCECTNKAVETIFRWVETEQAVFAHGLDEKLNVEVAEGTELEVNGLFFAHGGLGPGFWREIGCPTLPSQAAEAINKLPMKVASRPGEMLGGVPSTMRGLPPGPVWSLAHLEVWAEWDNDGAPPFSQMHGHSAAFHWPSNQWFTGVSGDFMRSTLLFPDKRVSVTGMENENYLFGMDPSFGVTTKLAEQPFVKLH